MIFLMSTLNHQRQTQISTRNRAKWHASKRVQSMLWLYLNNPLSKDCLAPNTCIIFQKLARSKTNYLPSLFLLLPLSRKILLTSSTFLSFTDFLLYLPSKKNFPFPLIICLHLLPDGLPPPPYQTHLIF